MILRQVRRLEPGMTVRLPVPGDGETSSYNIRQVDPRPEPQRWRVVFGIGDEEHAMNFFPDDLVEVLL